MYASTAVVVQLRRVHLKSQKKAMTPLLRKCLNSILDVKLATRIKVGNLIFLCTSCAVNLRAWITGSRPSMPFAVPMAWRELKIMVQTVISCWQMFWADHYQNDDSLSVGLPNPRAVLTIGDVGETVTKETEDCIDPDFQPLQCREPHLITQRELKFNDLVRDWNSLKESRGIAGLSASGMEFAGTRN